ncbi:cyclic nucleotide-binding domain-containing protein [bacterium]|nr:cyclic nucleotide-binding domain-containing protein [FCB group bacterium]MBL7192048.1 cyclic nucleotide-binding domain-containing protein [bacterium]
MEKLVSSNAAEERYRYLKGETVLKEGNASSIIYILMRGVLGIYKQEQKVTEIEQQGVIFGEMSSILGKSRTSTVKAETECEVMVYRGGVHSIIKKFPSVTSKILFTLAERLYSLTTNYSALKAKMDYMQKELDEYRSKMGVLERKDDSVAHKDKIDDDFDDILDEDPDLLLPSKSKRRIVRL